MGDDDEDEGCDDDVEHGVAWYEDKSAVGVGRHPDVVLTDEQLQWNFSKPGKKRAVSGTQTSQNVA